MKQLSFLDEIEITGINYVRDSQLTNYSCVTRQEEQCNIQNMIHQLGIPKQHIKGNDIHEILYHLSLNEDYAKEAHILYELCLQFSEKRIYKGEHFANSEAVFRHYSHRLSYAKQECFIVILLNHKHMYLGDIMVSRGTLNRSFAHPREIYSTAVEIRAGAIIGVHNHPSDSAEASIEDISASKRLKEAGKIIGIPILDFLIIADGTYFSMADKGLM